MKERLSMAKKPVSKPTPKKPVTKSVPTKKQKDSVKKLVAKENAIEKKTGNKPKTAEEKKLEKTISTIFGTPYKGKK